MNTMLRSIPAIALTSLGVLFACGGSNNQEPAVAGTGVTSPQTADSSVVEDLANARCDREQSCNNVGDGRHYASRDVCMNQVRGDLGNELNTHDCPRGIDQSKLDACKSAIKAEACDHPLDTLSRMDKCRTGALCLK
jgi:hypothetical protein